MALYQNKYRVESTRLPDWDYRNAGAYFITICVKNRLCLFGECIAGKMKLNDVGKIAHTFWTEIPQHFNHVALGEFVIMPNHMHGILILKNRVITEMPKSNNEKDEFMSAISPKAGSVSTIIRSYKSACTKEINLKFADLNFKWQERFHDHIIRSDDDFERISNYIKRNPELWNQDRFYATD